MKKWRNSRSQYLIDPGVAIKRAEKRLTVFLIAAMAIMVFCAIYLITGIANITITLRASEKDAKETKVIQNYNHAR